MVHLSPMAEKIIVLSSAVGDGHEIISIDAHTNREISRIPISTHSVNLLSTSYNGRKIVFTPDFKTVSIVDTFLGTIHNIQIFQPKSRIITILPSSDSADFIVIFPGIIYQIRFDTGKIVKKILTLYSITAACLVPGKSDEFICGYGDGFVEMKQIFGPIVRWRSRVSGFISEIQTLQESGHFTIFVKTREQEVFLCDTYSNLPIYNTGIQSHFIEFLPHNNIGLSDLEGTIKLRAITSDDCTVTKTLEKKVNQFFYSCETLNIVTDNNSLVRLNPNTLETIAIIPLQYPELVYLHFSSVQKTIKTNTPEVIPLEQRDFFRSPLLHPLFSEGFPDPVHLPYLSILQATIRLPPLDASLPVPQSVHPKISVPSTIQTIIHAGFPDPVHLPYLSIPQTTIRLPPLDASLPVPQSVHPEISVLNTIQTIIHAGFPEPVHLSYLSIPQTTIRLPTLNVSLPIPKSVLWDNSTPGLLLLNIGVNLPRPIKLKPIPINPILGFDLLDGCVKIHVYLFEIIRAFLDSKEIVDDYMPVEARKEYQISFTDYQVQLIKSSSIPGISEFKPFLLFQLTSDFCPQVDSFPQKELIIITAIENRITPDQEILGGGEIVNWDHYKWVILSSNRNTIYKLETSTGSIILYEPPNLVPFFDGGTLIKDLPLPLDPPLYSMLPKLILPGISHQWRVQIDYLKICNNITNTHIFNQFPSWDKNLSNGYLDLQDKYADLFGKLIFTITDLSTNNSHRLTLIAIPSLYIEFISSGPFIPWNQDMNTVHVRIYGPDHVANAEKQGDIFNLIIELDGSLPKIMVRYAQSQIEITLLPPILYYSFEGKRIPVGIPIKQQWEKISLKERNKIDLYIPHYLQFLHYTLSLASDSDHCIIQQNNEFSLKNLKDYSLRTYSLDVFWDAISLFSRFTNLAFLISGEFNGNIATGSICSISSWRIYDLEFSNNYLKWSEYIPQNNFSRLVFIDKSGVEVRPMVKNNSNYSQVTQPNISQYSLKFKWLLKDSLFTQTTEWIDHSPPLNEVFSLLKTFKPETVINLLTSNPDATFQIAQIQAFCLRKYPFALKKIKDTDYDSQLLEAYCKWKCELDHPYESMICKFPQGREIKLVYAAAIARKNPLQAAMILKMTNSVINLSSLNSIIELDTRIDLIKKGIPHTDNLLQMAIDVLSHFYFIGPLWNIIQEVETMITSNHVHLSSLEYLYTDQFVWFKAQQNTIQMILQLVKYG